MIGYIAIILYFIAQAIIENEVWTKKYKFYHLLRLIELGSIYVAILTFSDNLLNLAGIFFIGDFIFEMIYNYLTYGYFDKEKQYKLFKWDFTFKPVYNLYILGIGVLLVLL